MTRKFQHSTMLKIMTLVLCGSTALAGSLNLDFRFDYDSLKYNDAGITAGGVNSSRFYLQTGRLDYKGKFNEDLSFRTRIRFNQDYSATSNYTSYKGSSIPKFVDYAYLTHKVAEGYSLTFGKFGSDMAGFEGATSGADLYFQSIAYAASQIYITGVKGTGVFGDHEVSLMAGNTFTDSVNGTTIDQTRMASGLIYKGNFMEKSLNLIASYYNQSIQNSTDGRKDTLATVGVKYGQDAWYAALDFDSYSYFDQTVANKTDKTASTVLSTAYKFDRSTAKLLFESSEVTTFPASVETSTKYSTMGAVYEFRPTNEEGFRYHVAYTGRTTKPATGDDRVETHMLAGIRLNSDFLK